MSDPATNAREIVGPNQKIPLWLAGGVGLQLTALLIPGIVGIPLLVFRGAGQSEETLLWAVFASVLISGLITALQSMQGRRIGAGYLFPVGAAGAVIAVSIAALQAGGPALLASLVITLALFQFAFSRYLALFRRVLSPTVTGTVIMLVPVTVMPEIFKLMTDLPNSALYDGGPISAFVTLAVIVGVTLIGSGPVRLWAPIMGVVAGCLVALYFGLYDLNRVADAPWFGIPAVQWPGIDLELNAAFWTLLIAFLFVGVVCTIQTISGAVATQHVSWNGVKAVDFRSVQSTVAADSAGNLLIGITGAIPIVCRPHGVSMIEITGVSARTIGYALGAILVVLAFLPKGLALVLAIPSPVIATFITIALASLFTVGIKVVMQGGMDFQKGTIVGIAFLLGVGFQFDAIFPEFVARMTGGLPLNGIIAGGTFTILVTLLLELTKPRRHKVEVALDQSALHTVRDFIADFSRRSKYHEAMASRLDAVGEETLLSLMAEGEETSGPEIRRLRVVARMEDGGVTLEFFAAGGEGNMQDRIALLGDVGVASTAEREISLRILRHLAASVRHQQYHDTDVITVHVDPPPNST